jgi:hypothetical protein
MAEKKQKISEEEQRIAERKLAEYKAFVRRQRQLNILRATVAAIGFAVVVMLFAGNRFEWVFRSVGLTNIYHEETGVYADCSKRENRNSPFCAKKENAADKNWKSISQGAGPFNLTDKR